MVRFEYKNTRPSTKQNSNTLSSNQIPKIFTSIIWVDNVYMHSNTTNTQNSIVWSIKRNKIVIPIPTNLKTSPPKLLWIRLNFFIGNQRAYNNESAKNTWMKTVPSKCIWVQSKETKNRKQNFILRLKHIKWGWGHEGSSLHYFQFKLPSSNYFLQIMSCYWDP